MKRTVLLSKKDKPRVIVYDNIIGKEDLDDLESALLCKKSIDWQLGRERLCVAFSDSVWMQYEYDEICEAHLISKNMDIFGPLSSKLSNVVKDLVADQLVTPDFKMPNYWFCSFCEDGQNRIPKFEAEGLVKKSPRILVNIGSGRKIKIYSKSIIEYNIDPGSIIVILADMEFSVPVEKKCKNSFLNLMGLYVAKGKYKFL